LILGIDFWKTFSLAPNVIPSISTLENSPKESESTDYPLTNVQKQQLEAIKKLFPSFTDKGLGRTKLIEHDIEVDYAKPIKQRFYPLSPAVEKILYKEVDRILSLGVIEPSTSAWSSPMRLVLKPNKVRLCLDARKLNNVTQKDAYPLASIEGILSWLLKAEMISKIDLKDAYWQIGLTERAKALKAKSFYCTGKAIISLCSNALWVMLCAANHE